MDAETTDRAAAEARFAGVFCHLGLITAYARRRGARDADEIAAAVMAIAWRRLADVPCDDPRPWLIATARSGATAQIGDGRYFAIVMPQNLPGYQLQTFDAAGRALITDRFDPGM
jgi:DNA-directed RNA polymerase specialized sigma24 family protein